MADAMASKRPTCTTCLRPQSTCICHWITPTAHAVEVVVLQHPLEVHNAKGSARLLHLSLPHSQLLTGEVFTQHAMQALLAGPRQAVLLYPDTPVTSDKSITSVSRALPPELLHSPSQLRLIVLDGTWRKSRKMLHLNPLLQRIPRLSLRDLPASHYLIRKAHRPDQLSTLEATCAALTQLEGNAHQFQPLLAAFDGFVAQQLAHHQMRGCYSVSPPPAPTLPSPLPCRPALH
jgi:DTW domain-containing protein YfiP